MIARLLIAGFAVLFCSASALASPEDIRSCDELAALPLSQHNPEGIAGVALTDIRWHEATKVCDRAYVAAQDTFTKTRMEFQLLRAYYSAGLRSKKYAAEYQALFWRLVDEGMSAGSYGPTENIVGSALLRGFGVAQNAAEGLRRLTLAADAGLPHAQYQLAVELIRGRHVDGDFARAKSLLLQAGEAGVAAAYTQLADAVDSAEDHQRYLVLAAEIGGQKQWYELSHALTYQDPAAAKRWLIKAGLAGDREAQYEVADSFYYGYDGFPKDHRRALKWYLRNMTAHANPEAAINAGFMYRYGKGTEPDPIKALVYYELAADQGHPLGQYNLGNILEHGTAGTVDLPRAIALYEAAAAQGLARAQHQLGDLYRLGKGVPQDWDKSYEFHVLAADQNYWPAVAAKGRHHLFGWSGPVARARGEGLLVQAAEEGISSAAMTLGRHYFRGKWLRRNDKKAMYWLTAAAGDSEKAAGAYLGFMFNTGRGVKRDLAKARYWYERGAGLGDPSAQRLWAWFQTCEGRACRRPPEAPGAQ